MSDPALSQALQEARRLLRPSVRPEPMWPAVAAAAFFAAAALVLATVSLLVPPVQSAPTPPAVSLRGLS
jgi:hypothetical protein